MFEYCFTFSSLVETAQNIILKPFAILLMVQFWLKSINFPF